MRQIVHVILPLMTSIFLCCFNVFAISDAFPYAIIHDENAIVHHSANRGAQSYSVWSSVINSYLFVDNDQNLTRVEYIDGSLVVESYNSSFQLLDSGKIELELPLFGGFYHGDSYNFIVCGNVNYQESDQVEVIRVIKYTSDWKRVGASSLYGANTTVPFQSGSLRIAENKGMLYLHTCHEMYTSSDGLHHQANLLIAVHIEDMRITFSNCDISSMTTGYVSHSFNQFVISNHSDSIFTLDHGDGFPRSAVLVQYQSIDDGNTLNVFRYQQVVRFPGLAGENTTGAGFGGLEESSKGFLIAGNWSGGSLSSIRNAYIWFVDPNMSNITCIPLTTEYRDTNSSFDYSASVPHIVKVSDDLFLVMWQQMRRRMPLFMSDDDFSEVDPAGMISYIS